MRELARGFEGAYPYLELIARANAIADPLDRRVVEAYWLGSPLLDRSRRICSASRCDRGSGRGSRSRRGGGCESSAPAGAKPVHAFHVLDVFPKVGLMRSEQVEDVLRDHGLVSHPLGPGPGARRGPAPGQRGPARHDDGKLAFGPPRIEQITAWRDGRGFISEVRPGDVVSIHWDWACDVLAADQVDAAHRLDAASTRDRQRDALILGGALRRRAV